MESVPFAIDLGLTTVQGILRLDDHGLAVEWRIFDLMGAPRGELESMVLPYERMTSVEYRKSVVGSRLEITTDRPDSLRSFPLPSGAITSLRVAVKRQYRDSAQALAAEAALRIAESDGDSDRSG